MSIKTFSDLLHVQDQLAGQLTAQFKRIDDERAMPVDQLIAARQNDLATARAALESAQLRANQAQAHVAAMERALQKLQALQAKGQADAPAAVKVADKASSKTVPKTKRPSAARPKQEP